VVRELGDPLWRFVRRMAGAGTAEDLMQETLIKIHGGLRRWRPSGSLRAFCFTIARNVVRDHWKHQSRRPEVALGAQAEDPRAPEPADRLERDEAWSALRAAIRRLPPDQREVFLLREEGDLSFAEIARLTGAPLNTVLGRMHYAIRNLRADVHELRRR
jgi:RNA polymerase sigma-70 factor (ECF subfamily)